MKREKSYYNDFQIYEDRDSYVTNWHSRIVKTRKEHYCYYCATAIPVGAEALLETCIDPYEGRCATYTCGKCVDSYIEDTSDTTDQEVTP